MKRVKKLPGEIFFRVVYWLFKSKLESDDIGRDTLTRMRAMKNNNNWVFDQIKPYLGNSILEVGAGIGNISKYLAGFDRKLILTDIKRDYLNYLKNRFISYPKVKVISFNIESGKASKISKFKVDTAICINVLEHIKNDNQALRNIHKILSNNGSLILIVPALKKLYGSLDKNLGHFRRYDKNQLIKKLEKNNYFIEKIYYHNLVSVFGWFINSRILKTKFMKSFQLRLLDKLIPFLATVEKNIEIPFGLSLIVIAKKR